MSQLNKTDVCVNHALGIHYGALSEAYRVFVKESESFRKTNKNKSFLWNKFLGYLAVPHIDDAEVESFPCDNIVRHSCSISSFTKHGKRYVWYNNPWGHHRDILGQDDPPIKDKWLVPFQGNTVHDIRNEIVFDDEEYLFEQQLIYLCGARVRQIVDNDLAANTESVHTIVPRVLAWLDKWLEDGAECDRERHVMTTLYLLKELTNSDHLVVIHPTESMSKTGPQSCDGVETITDAILHKSYGACAHWTIGYIDKVRTTIGADIGTQNQLSHFEEIVKNTLKKYVICDTHLAIANLEMVNTSDHTDRNELRYILSSIYDMIPANDGSVYATRFHEKSPYNSSWYQEILWKLNIMLDKTNNLLQTGEYHKQLIIASGYIEVVNIMTIVYGREHETVNENYIEVVARLVGFVHDDTKMNMFSQKGLLRFQDIMILMVTCKHNRVAKPNEISPKQYSALHFTRQSKEFPSQAFNFHWFTYGYGVELGEWKVFETDGRTESGRKRRRMEINL